MKKYWGICRFWPVSLYFLGALILAACRSSSTLAEYVFARFLYPPVSLTMSWIASFIPFSLLELAVCTIPAAGCFLIYRIICAVHKGQFKSFLVKTITFAVSFGGIIFLFYAVFCGANYSRYSIGQYLDLTVQPSSAEELEKLCYDLTVSVNQLREGLKEDEDGVFMLSGSFSEIAGQVQSAYQKIGEQLPVLGGRYPKPKPIFFSEFMSRLELTGIFCTFTMEANINTHAPAYSIPATMCHELAHLRGFMREDEANFIAYLVTAQSQDAQLQYSGEMLALIYAGNQLYAQSPERYQKISALYSPGVSRDFAANNAYWHSYDNTVMSEISDKVNDTYLKINQQSDGVKSYGRMVDLLLALQRKEIDR